MNIRVFGSLDFYFPKSTVIIGKQELLSWRYLSYKVASVGKNTSDRRNQKSNGGNNDPQKYKMSSKGQC